MLGFLNLHKPPGMTSHDCVGRVRRILGLKRVGHGGTLDPLATGVLPIALGSATRLLPYLPEPKAYQATIRFGITTATDDLGGEILSQQTAGHLAKGDVEQALVRFQGCIQQQPPAYSAIQVNGQRLYDLARQGQPVSAPIRTVEIMAIQVLAWQSTERPEVEVAITCGSGTYIRSIARDLGEYLGTGATLAQLIRTRSCGLFLSDSLTFEALESQVSQGTFTPLSPSLVLKQPILSLSPIAAQRFSWGQKLPESDYPDGWVQVRDNCDRFLGIGEIREGLLRPKVVLPLE
ncbi:MAG: tRNA pseudouridine(55) synthase TruB [Acaryochloris sp. RU_4_1]|nr:tRNA pseudouridine(55) synthase TruB [Acaryochloris sp. RU_4_1]